MSHWITIGIKFFAQAVVLGILLTTGTNATLSQALLSALVLALVSYWIGDLRILPGTSPFTAAIADAGIAAVVIWILGAMMGLSIPAGTVFWSAVLIGAVEWLLHIGLQRTVAQEG